MSNILQYINIAVKALSQRDKIEQIIKEATPLIDKATPIVQEVLQKWPESTTSQPRQSFKKS